MQVSDWWMFLSFYQNVLAVPLAIVLFVLLLRARTRQRRVLYGALIVLAFVPHIQRFAGDYYFDYLCRTQAGEFIYRTVDNVEGILQMRPRDGSKDYFDRMRAGDIPEDPWGHTNAEAKRFRSTYVALPGSGKYSFIESVIAGKQPSNNEGAYEKYSVQILERAENGKVLSVREVREINDRSVSRFGYTWDEISNVFAFILHIYVGRIRIMDLERDQVLAEKIGILRVRPWQLCPEKKSEEHIFTFVSKVLRPSR